MTRQWSDNLTAEEAIRSSERHGMPMAQHGQEITDFLRWYLAGYGRPARVLEIGTQHGGTAALWCEIASEQVISVDMPLGIHGGLPQSDMDLRNERLSAAYPHFTAITGNSQEVATLRRAQEALGGNSLDLLFIDGDHRYECAKRDFDLYSPLVKSGGVVLFHDIHDTPFYRGLDVNVARLWRELVAKAPKRAREFNIRHNQWGGLGAVEVPL